MLRLPSEVNSSWAGTSAGTGIAADEPTPRTSLPKPYPRWIARKFEQHELELQRRGAERRFADCPDILARLRPTTPIEAATLRAWRVDAIERHAEEAGAGGDWLVHSRMPDDAIRVRAKRRAEHMARLIAARTPDTPEAFHEWLHVTVVALDAKSAPPLPEDGDGEGRLYPVIARVTCELWWRRQLRRAVVRLREREGRRAGEVCLPRQIYCTDDTAERIAARSKANAELLDRTKIESEDGEVITLAVAAKSSTANPDNRLAELMTRVRGCMEWCNDAKWPGVFLTLTTPSRFHATKHTGAPNPRHDGSTATDAKAWLCATWAKARASLHRAGVRMVGVRVAEPHHDGTPHWHALVWTDPQSLAVLLATLRRYWLAEDGNEPGAFEHRFKADAIDPSKGDALSYIATYIAKNINDAGRAGIEGHHDDTPDGDRLVTKRATANRAIAWARAHGIRQFQCLGQPPVMVWRELRRIKAPALQGATPELREAHAAAQREGEVKASWRRYMDAQGGAALRRDEWRLRLHAIELEQDGRYGAAVSLRPLGVEDRTRPGIVVLSERRVWRAEGAWGSHSAAIAALGPVSLTVRDSTQRPGGIRVWPSPAGHTRRRHENRL